MILVSLYAGSGSRPINLTPRLKAERVVKAGVDLLLLLYLQRTLALAE